MTTNDRSNPAEEGVATTSGKETDTQGQDAASPRYLAELIGLFLRLGFTAFGGPAAHIAMMRTEVVERRRWVSEARFVDLIGITKFHSWPLLHRTGDLPGLSTCWLARLVGRRSLAHRSSDAHRTGSRLGVCDLWSTSPNRLALLWHPAGSRCHYCTSDLESGVQSSKAFWRLLWHSWYWCSICLGSMPWSYFSRSPVLWGAALHATAMEEQTAAEQYARSSRDRSWTFRLESGTPNAWNWPPRSQYAFQLVGPLSDVSNLGAVVYGSGYTLLAFLRTDLVQNLHWLTDKQLLDAVSVGQFTPGPVFTTATFIGYLLGGLPGAVLATLAIFLPSFLFIALIHPVASRLRKAAWTATLLDGVNAAAMALMTGVLVQLGQHALTDVLTWAVALVSLAILVRWKINSVWLILAGAAIGLLRFWVLGG